MIDQSYNSNKAFVLPTRLWAGKQSPQRKTRRRNSCSSFGSWSSNDESSTSSFKKVAVGELPPPRSGSRSSNGSFRQHRPTLLGFDGHSNSRTSSEHWNSFYRRFQDKPQKTRRDTSNNRGIFSRVACRMLDCTRTMTYQDSRTDDWSDTMEVPMRQRSLEELRQAHWCFWDDDDDGAEDEEEEECRVDLTE